MTDSPAWRHFPGYMQDIEIPASWTDLSEPATDFPCWITPEGALVYVGPPAKVDRAVMVMGEIAEVALPRFTVYPPNADYADAAWCTDDWERVLEAVADFRDAPAVDEENP